MNYQPMKFQPKTPGVRAEVSSYGSRRYARVIHVVSGQPIKSFDSAPMAATQREFVAYIDSVLAGIDWMREAAVISNDDAARTAAWNCRMDKDDRGNFFIPRA